MGVGSCDGGHVHRSRVSMCFCKVCAKMLENAAILSYLIYSRLLYVFDMGLHLKSRKTARTLKKLRTAKGDYWIK